MAVTRIPIPDCAKVQKADDRLELSLVETELSVRTVNCLEEEGILTIADLLNCTEERVLAIPNLGGKTLETIYVALEKLGFYRPSRRPAEADETNHALLRGSGADGPMMYIVPGNARQAILELDRPERPEKQEWTFKKP